LIHGKLMTESQDLGLQGDPGAKRDEERGRDPEEESDHVEAPKMNGIMPFVPKTACYTEFRTSRIATVSSFREAQAGS
jgi:hypothetical protein